MFITHGTPEDEASFTCGLCIGNQGIASLVEQFRELGWVYLHLLILLPYNTNVYKLCSLYFMVVSPSTGALCEKPGDIGKEQTPGCSLRLPAGVCCSPEKAVQRHQSGGATEGTALAAGGDVHTTPQHAGRLVSGPLRLIY